MIWQRWWWPESTRTERPKNEKNKKKTIDKLRCGLCRKTLRHKHMRVIRSSTRIDASLSRNVFGRAHKTLNRISDADYNEQIISVSLLFRHSERGELECRLPSILLCCASGCARSPKHGIGALHEEAWSINSIKWKHMYGSNEHTNNIVYAFDKTMPMKWRPMLRLKREICEDQIINIYTPTETWFGK